MKRKNKQSQSGVKKIKLDASSSSTTITGKIYEIVCTDLIKESRRYIGSTTNPLFARMAGHRVDANNNKLDTFHQTMKNIGVDLFVIRELYEVKCNSTEELTAIEMVEINKYPKQTLLNTEFSRERSLETKEKVSKAHSLRTSEEKKKISARMSKANTKRGYLYCDVANNRWRFSWRESGRRNQKSKSFTFSTWGGKDEAHKEAIKMQDFMFPSAVVDKGATKKQKLYKITNTTNNKLYFGITKVWLSSRMAQHRSDARKNSPNNDHFHKEMYRLGPENFEIELVRNLDGLSKNCALDEEAKEMKKYPLDLLYNDIVDRKQSKSAKMKESKKLHKGGSVSFVGEWHLYNEENTSTEIFKITKKDTLEQCKTMALKRGENIPNVKIYLVGNWRSRWGENGKAKQKSFSIKKYGEVVAREKAAECLLKKFPQRKQYIFESTGFSEPILSIILGYLI